MRIIRTGLAPCTRCKKEAKDVQAQYRVPVRADILLLMLRPAKTVEEIESLQLFDGAIQAVLGRDPADIARAYVVRCCMEPVRTAQVRNCEPELRELLEGRSWRCVIACGTLVLKHVLMRGASSPSMLVMNGRPVKMREFGGITVVTIPDPLKLLVVEGNPNDKWFDAGKELMLLRRDMEKGLKGVLNHVGGAVR